MTATPPPPGGDSPDKDAIDAEFSKMMEGLSLDDSILGDAPGEGEAAPTVPDDLSSLHDTVAAEDPNAPAPFALVATPLASAKALAGVIRLALAAEDNGSSIPPGTVTLPAESGAVAAGALTEAEAHELAHLTSLGLQRQGVVLFWRQGDSMVASRYREGQNEGEVSPALVLGALSSEVEELLLGIESLDSVEETYDPGSLSREEALAWINPGRGWRGWGRKKDNS